MVTPKGYPAWVRNVDHTHYDGDVNKTNYLSRGVIDPRTDVGAEGFSRMTADLAAVVRVAPFCEMLITINDTAGTTVVPRIYMQTGVNAEGYPGTSPPSGFPSVAYNGDGDVTVTFASSYNDPYGVSGAFEIQCPQLSIVDNSGIAVYEKLTATTVRLRAYSADGATPLENITMSFSCMSGL